MTLGFHKNQKLQFSPIFITLGYTKTSQNSDALFFFNFHDKTSQKSDASIFVKFFVPGVMKIAANLSVRFLCSFVYPRSWKLEKISASDFCEILFNRGNEN